MTERLPPLHFDNRFVAELPGDAEESPRRRQVRGACWSPVLPTPVAAPRLLAHAREVAELVGLTDGEVAAPWFAEVFGGNRLLPGMRPYAACYGGHQFGHWAGQLGDGRAITLGETVNARGERWELQLKGAGPTPYSRTADGRAVLRSSIREFVCSEAMHHLGVPTTRALAVVTTGEAVVRDMFYDGHPRPEPGAVVCRVAPSFIRFGNFEIFAARGELDVLRRLVELTIARDFPHLGPSAPGAERELLSTWFAEICERTARLMVEWTRVGFVHGVMNTDNMSVLGLTIDYGPYGWLDDYDPTWTPNTTDAAGRRYRFGQQPAVAQWNLMRLAEALHPLVGDVAPLQAGLDRYADRYARSHEAMLAAKLGLREGDARVVPLAGDLLALLHAAEVDYTIFFRALSGLAAADAGDVEPFAGAFYDDAKRRDHAPAFARWLARWAAAAGERRDDERQASMRRVNPRYVPRNYLAQEAIDAAEAGDGSKVHDLLDVMRRPYDDQPGREPYAARRPDWARERAGCSMLSCSS